jgi:AcrR family transcriptional regulator
MRKKDDEKQRSIKEAVVKLILQEGFHGTSISKIAKEAGVSPATVYIYYENKETMLQDIYRGYSEEIFAYLLNKAHKDLEGQQLIEVLVYSYYSYIKENEEIFHFVDQFSSCPALVNQCGDIEGVYRLSRLLDEMKARRIVKNFHNENLISILLFPVKGIASNQKITEEEKSQLLQEMIIIIKGALLL